MNKHRDATQRAGPARVRHQVQRHEAKPVAGIGGKTAQLCLAQRIADRRAHPVARGQQTDKDMLGDETGRPGQKNMLGHCCTPENHFFRM